MVNGKLMRQLKLTVNKGSGSSFDDANHRLLRKLQDEPIVEDELATFKDSMLDDSRDVPDTTEPVDKPRNHGLDNLDKGIVFSKVSPAPSSASQPSSGNRLPVDSFARRRQRLQLPSDNLDLVPLLSLLTQGRRSLQSSQG